MEGFATIAQTIQATGLAGTAAIFIWLFIKERSYSQSLNAQILQQAVKSTEASMAQANALNAVKEVIINLRDTVTRSE